jgi:hypothetical protein
VKRGKMLRKPEKRPLNALELAVVILSIVRNATITPPMLLTDRQTPISESRPYERVIYIIGA